MAIRLRLARHHLTRNAAQYNLVATESSRRPTAQPLELLGTYNPRPAVLAPAQRSPNGQRRPESEWGPGQYPPRTATAEVGIKAVEWNLERVRHWLSQGALPSKAVEKLLVQAGVINTNPLPQPTQKGPVMSRQRRLREAVRAAEKARGEVPVAQRRMETSPSAPSSSPSSAQPSA
ncbi:hypothetical protein JCM8115_006711 [Rhodotorula mucilaginosa]|uniref:37S ribosomal protein S16, mitochondrial n=1 Tax=Rhodotorula mucilaginosa TaxID=5537 RepID=A0A9P7B8T9_RHOMI|nr:37S ribosomal protein S16, mitochondrial [Rhodotorula mucilaginosa]TKA54864.1 hypothetical protein B0A53_02673 [Rhodotorula sp. CCFEE 5036]